MNLSTKVKYTQEIFDSVKEFSFEKIKEVYFKYEDKNYSYDFKWLKRKYDTIFYKEYNSLIAFINDLDYNHKLYNMAKLEQKIIKAPFIFNYLDSSGLHIFEMDAETIEIKYDFKK